MIQELLNKHIASIQEKKDNLVKQRLFEYLGYELDILKESQRRFPRLLIISQNDEISYYWNDGTDNGYRLITFYYEPYKFNELDNTVCTYFSYK